MVDIIFAASSCGYSSVHINLNLPPDYAPNLVPCDESFSTHTVAAVIPYRGSYAGCDMAFTTSQLYAIEISTRVATVLSLSGAVFIIASFLFDKGFQKPINRLIFCAAWGNVLTNVATIISRAGIEQHGLCQLQGFLIQWLTRLAQP